MKMHAVEVVNPDAPVFADFNGHYKDCRPLETEADQIAAAIEPGEIHARCLFDLFDDPWQEWHDKYCITCSTESGTVAAYWAQWRDDCKSEMIAFEVEWDPTITF